MPETKINSFEAVRTARAYTVMVLLHLLLLLLSPSKTKAAESVSISQPECHICDEIPIPYPFGIRSDCSFSDDFVVSCQENNTGSLTPYLFNSEVLNINIALGQARISTPISYQCYNLTTNETDSGIWVWDFSGSPYKFNSEKNKFMVMGCNTVANVFFYVNQSTYRGTCGLHCYSLESLMNVASCSGIGCCQIVLAKNTYSYAISFDQYYVDSYTNFSRCGHAMLMEDAEFTFNSSYITTDALERQNMPVVIDWVIGNTTCYTAQADKSSYACKSENSKCSDSSSEISYLCNCSDGYRGNPYLDNGCQDINECDDQNPCSKPAKCHNTQGDYRCICPFGWHKQTKNTCEINLALLIEICASILALLLLGFGIYVILERRKVSKVMEKYFDQHGGSILLEKIKSNQVFGFTIFTKQQLEQATNNFDSATIIGHGGQGTVYKGTLSDQIIAIKKCKIVDENKKKEFGKEMLILSQINHKNIVKLLGCCIEVEVPMLVYEFISNGTLSDFINNKRQGSHIPLGTRLKIAQQSAEALAYLHSSASPPIFHGDVKSTNILLDQNYMAKVSDFGASILAPTDEAQMVTLVQGTCGYLDPEYLQSCKLTDKSDVYSFGVVILELLTNKPVIDFDTPEEERGLSSRFLAAMKENKMNELLDDEIKCEDDMKVIIEVAELAKKCLNMKGEERPIMKEVAEELDQIWKIKEHPWKEYHPEELEALLGGASHAIEIEHTSNFSLEKISEKSTAIGR